MQGTSSAPSSESILDAALADAEGRELVERITARKRLRNIRERFIQQMVFGDVHTDGHGNVIPRQEPEHWESLKAAAVEGANVTYTRSLNKPDTVTINGHPALGFDAGGWSEILTGLFVDPHMEAREVVRRFRLNPVAIPDAPPIASVSREGLLYNRKLIGENGSGWVATSGYWGDKQQ